MESQKWTSNKILSKISRRAEKKNLKNVIVRIKYNNRWIKQQANISWRNREQKYVSKNPQIVEWRVKKDGTYKRKIKR